MMKMTKSNISNFGSAEDGRKGVGFRPPQARIGWGYQAEYKQPRPPEGVNPPRVALAKANEVSQKVRVQHRRHLEAEGCKVESMRGLWSDLLDPLLEDNGVADWNSQYGTPWDKLLTDNDVLSLVYYSFLRSKAYSERIVILKSLREWGFIK